MFNSKNLSLKDIIKSSLFKNLQEMLTEIVGLAYNIVDFKGNPVITYSNFSSFCKKVRSTEKGRNICCSSNAHAGLESALKKEPYIYICPYGLIDISIPIIANDEYLGSVLFGQIRTNENKFPPLKGLNDYSDEIEKDRYLKKEYFNIKYIEYDKIISMASLVYNSVNQLIQQIIEEKLQKEKLQEELKTSKLKVMQSEVNPHFLFNVLNSAANLALIEGADRTQQMLYSLAELYRDTSRNTGKKVNLEDEMKNVIKYLEIQCLRFGERVKYNINIDMKMNHIKIPSMIIQCFVENAVMYGISLKKEGGTIGIDGHILNNDAIITISDNGLGIPNDKLCLILNGQYKKESIGIGIYNANEKLAYYYGSEYKVKIESTLNIGTKIILKFPLLKNEMERNYV
ncbi:MAG: PocR ligand-binding domain-containing protein [Clostridium sp.]|uniref:sensor histidine kinase n=1 Tax=Clostridium sp. TaxID=1506 RepID=UPI0025C246B5|nr:PocR ligand-binding domain-containing protein [Clostridium sp.]MCE5221318.1 PocR ligand-binding domain-containing protein [Clostridium sp.]